MPIGRWDLRGNGEHWCAAAVCVIEALDRVGVSWSAAAGAHRQPASKLRLSSRCKRTGLVVANIQPLDIVAAADRIDNGVQAVADNPVHTRDPGLAQHLDQLLRYSRLTHLVSISREIRLDAARSQRKCRTTRTASLNCHCRLIRPEQPFERRCVCPDVTRPHVRVSPTRSGRHSGSRNGGPGAARRAPVVCVRVFAVMEDNQFRNAQTEHSPDPSDVLPALDECELSVLRRVGHEWDRVCGDPKSWREALPVDPDLGSYPAPKDILSASVLVTAAITKFTAGAWVSLLIIGLCVLAALRIRGHYMQVENAPPVASGNN